MKMITRTLMLFCLALAINVQAQQIIFEDFETGDPFVLNNNVNTDFPSATANCSQPSYVIGHNLDSVCDAFPDVPAINPEPGHCMSMNETYDFPPTRIIYQQTGLNLDIAPHVIRFNTVQRLASFNTSTFTQNIQVSAQLTTLFPFNFAFSTVALPLNNSSWVGQTLVLNPTSASNIFELVVTNPQHDGDFAIDDIELCGTNIQLTHIGPNPSCMDEDINICGTVEGCGLIDQVELLFVRDNQFWLTLEVDVNPDGSFCYNSPNADELISLGLEPGLYYDVLPVLRLSDPAQTILTGNSFLLGADNDFRLSAVTGASAVINSDPIDDLNDLTSFCHGDPIFFHGTTEFSESFNIAVGRRLIGSQNAFAFVGSTLEPYSFDGASYDLTTEFNFEFGYEYQVTFWEANVPECTGWTPVVKTFEVTDCCAIEPYGHSTFPECTFDGHTFTVEVYFHETLTEDDIDLIYSTAQNFDLLSTNIEVIQPSGETIISLTFESQSCSCEGDMLSFDIRLAGCEENIWIMSGNIPCCTSDCSDIELDYLEIVGDCEITENYIAYNFEGAVNLLPGSQVVSITAQGTGGLCPTNIAAFDYEVVNGSINISGIVQSLNTNCQWGDIELNINTEEGCCKLVIPISYPVPCNEVQCDEFRPSIESLCSGWMTISVPGSPGSVTVTNNLTGQNSTHPIVTVQCVSHVTPSGPVTYDCDGFLYNFPNNCKQLENPEQSKYDITIIIGGCDFRFIGDYCQQFNCNPSEVTNGQGEDRSIDQGKDLLTDFEVNIFPNPTAAGGTLTIQSSTSIREVSLLDMQGRLITNQHLDKTSTNFNMNTPDELQPGVYVVKVISAENETKMKRVLVLNQ